MTDTHKSPGQSLVITNQRPRAIFSPSWNGPTRELPLYNRGAAAVPTGRVLVAYDRPVQGFRPTLVATARYLGRAARAFTWRPDLWPPSIWVPLLLSTPVLGLGAVLATVHVLST